MFGYYWIRMIFYGTYKSISADELESSLFLYIYLLLCWTLLIMSFLVDSLFFRYIIISQVNAGDFVSYILKIYSFSFPSFKVLTRTSWTMLNVNSNMMRLHLIQTLNVMSQIVYIQYGSGFSLRMALIVC